MQMTLLTLRLRNTVFMILGYETDQKDFVARRLYSVVVCNLANDKEKGVRYLKTSINVPGI